jgi:hypothetical protein
MSVLQNITGGQATAQLRPRMWQRLTRVLNWRDDDNPYSPTLCILLLLIMGLLIKFGPAIHHLLVPTQ